MTRARPRFAFELFLLSFAAIVLEVSYTRIFSFKVFYYFTYLIIGVALLGMGAGGVLVATIPALRRVPLERLVPRFCLLGALIVPAGYLLVATLQLNVLQLTQGPSELAKLLLTCGALFGQFLVAGIVIAAVFAELPERIDRLYAADLAGAALGCAACVPLLRALSPPGCVMLGALVYLLAGMRLSRAHGGISPWLSVPTALLLALGVAAADRLPDPVVDQAKTMSPQRRTSRLLFSRWDPVFRVDVVAHPIPTEPHYILNHDGTWGSVLTRFDGDLGSLTRFETDTRSYPFRLGTPPRDVLIVGAAGGHEILASLYFRAGAITGVELNPVTTSLLTGRFADYTGRLTRDPRVTLLTAEGRSFLAGDPHRYDLIWFVAPDSYAAMNAATAGAFVLSESYLYTVETIVESVQHLSTRGIICMQFGEIDFERRPNRTARYLTTAREAFARLGISDFERHVLVATSPSFGTLATILLSREPFTAAQAEAFAGVTQRIEGSVVRHVPGATRADGIVGTAITAPPVELTAALARHPYQVGPVTDDSPFFWHFTGFRRAITGVARDGKALLDPSEGAGERVLLAFLACAVLLGTVALLLPFVTIRRTWADIPHKAAAAAYFGAIGTGFMFFEIVLIQKLTLLLGYPTYSLSVTLFALLLSTGLGSLASRRWVRRRNATLGLLLASVTLLALAYQLGLDPLRGYLGGASLARRIAAAVVLLVPLGLCLGAFMPLGIRAVAGLSHHPTEFVAWAWAVNGFASVISSILAVMFSMVLGFNAVLFLGVGTYLVAGVALTRMPDCA